MSIEKKELYQFGPFSLDLTERILLRDGAPVPLASKAFDALLVLIENRGRIIERDELMNKVWPESFVEEGNLKVTIFKLRKALGESADGSNYIETIPRRGYRFIAEVTRHSGPQLIVEKLTSSRVLIRQEESIEDYDQGVDKKLDASVVSTPTSIIKSKTGLFVILGAILFLAVGYWLLTKPKESAIARQSVAVLPFKLLGADEKDQYLSLGLAETLITKLGHLSAIEVRSISAVRRYVDADQDSLAAGRELNTRYVLEGSIQRLGDRLRLTARLVSVADGKTLWADTFDDQFTDIFKVQDSISEKVAAALLVKLTGNERKLLVKRYTENIEAYQSYLKGRFYWNKRTPEGIKKGIQNFQEAIEKDPNYALAFAGLADCYSMMGRDFYASAKAAASRAIDIDFTLSEAHTSLGHILMRHEYDWDGAAKELRLAIENNPNYATAHQWYSIYLELTGQPDKAIDEARRARQLDPLSPIITQSLGDRLYNAGRYDEAIELMDDLLEMDPGVSAAHGTLGLAYLQKRMFAEGVNQMLALRQASDSPIARGLLGYAYGASGKRAEAQSVLAELLKAENRGNNSSIAAAMIYAGLDEKALSIDLLEKAFANHEDIIVFIKVDHLWDRLRSEERFQNLIRQMGLLQ